LIQIDFMQCPAYISLHQKYVYFFIFSNLIISVIISQPSILRNFQATFVYDPTIPLCSD